MKYCCIYYVSLLYRSSCLYLKHCPFLFYTQDVSEPGFCLRLKVRPTQLGPIDRASSYLRTPAPTPHRIYQAKHSTNHLWELRQNIKTCIYYLQNRVPIPFLLQHHSADHFVFTFHTYWQRTFSTLHVLSNSYELQKNVRVLLQGCRVVNSRGEFEKSIKIPVAKFQLINYKKIK
jgi:hypothetical protein